MTVIASESFLPAVDEARREEAGQALQATRMRGRMDRLGELDLASQDSLVGVVRELEKQLWMLRSSRTKGGA